MASSKDYLDYVLEQLRDLEDITYRPMMSEYILYYQGKVFGGIYDDRFLVKITESSKKLMPDARKEFPYEGAKEMLLADIDDRELLNRMIPAMAEELPAVKKRKKRENKNG